MPLTGTQREQLQDALISAFPTSDLLAQMLQHQLDESLEKIGGTGPLSSLVFKSIQWAEAQGRTSDLVRGARRANPSNPALRALAVELGFTEAGSAALGTTAGVDPIADWLDFGLRRHGQLRVVGFREQHKIPIDLDRIFVPLSVHAARGRRGVTSEKGDKGDKGEALHDGVAGVSLDEALGLAGDGQGGAHLALIGYPGAGKTTLLRHLYRRAAHRDFPDALAHLRALVPVMVRLANVTGEELCERGLRRVIEREARDQGYAEAGPRLLARPEVAFLFLLDGLDEVRDEATRKRLCTWLDREVDHWPRSAFVATSRPGAWERTPDLAARFLPVTLRGLGPEAMTDYVRRWFTAVEVHFRGANPVPVAEARGQEKAEALLAAIRDPRRRASARLAEMTANPLLLSTLCLVHYSDKRLPEQRGELYHRSIGLLLETWAGERTGQSSLPNDAARLVLQPLAYAMQERDLRELSVDEAVALMREPLTEVPALRPVTPTAEKFLEVACDECGVLASRDLGRVEFFHLSFQEYLAAAHVAERGLARALADRTGEPRWEEVILLAMSMPGVFRPFMERVLERGDAERHHELLRQCLADATRLDPQPFVAAAARALARLQATEAAAAPGTTRLPAAPDPAAELRGLFDLVRGHDLPGLVAIARELANHPRAELRAAARALAGLVEEPVAGGPRWGEPFVEPVTGLSLLWIPPGRFTMGSSKEQGLPNFDREADDDELPAHPVEISEGFWLGEHPVTNEQYGRFVTATGHRAPEALGDRRFNDPAQPVVTVDWEDALAFCSWVSGQLRAQAGLQFDLPTEAEWEYAARGSDERKYPWGQPRPDAKRACYGQEWESGQPTAVGRHPAGKSPFGAHDMAGNVWEWCLDTWRDDYYSDEPLVDPCDQDYNRASPRVVRGGSWYDDPWLLRCASRVGRLPGGRDQLLGFRVVCRGPRQP